MQVNVDAGTFMQLKPAEFLLQAPEMMLKGNVYLGAGAETGVPLMAGAASPPSPSVFVSPLWPRGDYLFGDGRRNSFGGF